MTGTDAAGVRAKILIVDDRAENLLALEAILSTLDAELIRARSGETALDAVRASEFAVILLDVLMPGMDGFETAAGIKEQGRTPDVPIIFLTAAGAEPEFAFRGYAAGAVDYISKPFDPWVLRAKVSVYVDLYRKDRHLQVAAEQLGAVEKAAAVLSGLPEAQGPGLLADGLSRLDDAVAALRAALGYLPGEQPSAGRPLPRPPRGSRRSRRARGSPSTVRRRPPACPVVLANYPGRDARHHAAVRDLAADHRARRDRHVAADPGARQDDRARPEPGP